MYIYIHEQKKTISCLEYIRLVITKLPYKSVKIPPKRADRRFIYFEIHSGEKIFRIKICKSEKMSFLVFLKTMLFLIKFHTFLPILVTKKYLKKRKYVFYFMLFTFLFLLPLVSYLYIFWRCISSPLFVAF